MSKQLHSWEAPGGPWVGRGDGGVPREGAARGGREVLEDAAVEEPVVAAVRRRERHRRRRPRRRVKVGDFSANLFARFLFWVPLLSADFLRTRVRGRLGGRCAWMTGGTACGVLLFCFVMIS